MQAKPLAITIFVFGILAFGADTWLSKPTDAGVVLDKSLVATVPSRQVLQQLDTLDVVRRLPEPLGVAEDSARVLRTVAQKLEDLILIAKIEKDLFRDSELRAYDFNIEPDDGDGIILSGDVASEKQRQRAVNVVQRVTGVQSVKDQIRVIPHPSAISE